MVHRENPNGFFAWHQRHINMEMAEMEVDENFLWSQFEAAACESSFEINEPTTEPSCVEINETDEWGVSSHDRRDANLKARCCRLPDGDMHICGPSCPYGEQTKDGDLVCIYSGLVVSRTTEERTDLSTGRSTYSLDPDVNSSCVGYGGAWRARPNALKASSSAHQMSKQLDDSLMPEPIELPPAARTSLKRGALCVDEEAIPDNTPKRNRVCKKDVASQQTIVVLTDEAISIFSKLLRQSATDESKPKVATSTTNLEFDPRLLNFELLYTAAVKRYLKQATTEGSRPSIDELNNIALAVKKVISDEKAKQSKELRGDVHGNTFRRNAARLAVAIWSAACSTDYLSNAKRGTDSFRPFCVGVYYAFKRGFALPDGSMIVPKIDAFAKALPKARAIATNAHLKSLHASNHRGLCTLHRVIGAAGSPENARRLFSEALSIAATL
tara:strand:- start:2502 stop:3827 length:1326 start_codon:yes stop_codon:yes gene_type:complete